MMRQNSILVDGNNLAMAAHATSRKLTTKDGRPSGTLFTFLRTLAHLVKEFPNHHVHVLWDAGRTWRHDLLDSYKESRKTEPGEGPKNEFMESYKLARANIGETLSYLEVSQLRAPGYEADDIAAYLSSVFRREHVGGSLIAVSNDKDWLQLVHYDAKVYLPAKKALVDHSNFAKHTEGCTTAEMFSRAKAIAGDDGDDVPGVPGVGLLTAVKYLKGDLKSGSAYEKIEAWIKDPNGFPRSLTLVDLTSPRQVNETLEYRYGSRDASAFRKICEDMEYNSILKNFDKWFDAFV